MALFSKKHYQALRDALRAEVHKPSYEDHNVADVISSIAAMLECDNPAFERQRFITEIYVPEAKPEHQSQESGRD